MGAGEVLCIALGAVHRFENTATATPRRSRSSPPASSAPDYFREVAAVLEAAAGGPPDLTAIAAVMRRHGLTPAS